ncbi:hypothetical protein PHET_08499 [Paragonimus heterotremus]|uniref:Uncharacterized protein n=1 Tax=Paragonimus heterotremus TaxID=100268 RepID=A0A8J4SUW9_9TREM|nr:hypothetical protein PHET_08499 [Paragonimus heterotremus]
MHQKCDPSDELSCCYQNWLDRDFLFTERACFTVPLGLRRFSHPLTLLSSLTLCSLSRLVQICSLASPRWILITC